MIKRKKICSIVKNNITYDIRVQRISGVYEKLVNHVVLIGTKTKDTPEKEIRNNIEILKISVTRKNIFENRLLRITFNLLVEFVDNIKFFFTALKQRSDLYISNDIDTLFEVFFAAKFNKSKLIYDAHELYLEEVYAKKLKYPFLRWLAFQKEKFISRRANKVITVNKAIAKELSKRYGIEEPEVVMNCPPLYKLTDINNSPLRLTLKKKYPEKKYVLYQGLVSPVRGLEKVIEAVKEVEDVVFAILGHGRKDYREKLRDFSKKMGVEERVVILDAVSPNKLLDWTKGADIGIHAPKNIGLSYYLSTPNKLFEYMMAGLPVAVSNFPEMKRIVEKEKCGITFDPDNPKDIAEKIKYILENEERRKEMARNARRAAEEKYNWEEQEKILLRVYKKTVTV